MSESKIYNQIKIKSINISMSLKKINFTEDQIQQLIELGTITLGKPHKSNEAIIGDILRQGEENAFVYLQRYKKNQKLNILEQNSLYSLLHALKDELLLPTLPVRIECYDISHISGKFVYGSCVNFFEGRPDKKHYKLFKCPDKNNDFENHAEVLKRRLSHMNEEGWPNPDLIIVDGGKGQLSSDFKVLYESGYKIPIVSLAKKEEEIFTLQHFQGFRGDGQQGGILLSAQAGFLTQRIRDEAHRFAITNNRKARIKSITKTSFDEIKGIGPITITKLLRTYGSKNEIIKNMQDNPTLMVKLIGQKNFELIKDHFTSPKK
jgi:excinuclease ABC subunit C